MTCPCVPDNGQGINRGIDGTSLETPSSSHNDVVPDPERAGHALVVLNHPAEAKVQDTLSTRPSMIARKTLLARDYGLEPRNEVTRESGWRCRLMPTS
jgi:hypothetical protein